MGLQLEHGKAAGAHQASGDAHQRMAQPIIMVGKGTNESKGVEL